MKVADTIKRSTRNLKSAKIRTLLTACAIAVGGFTLTLTLAAANGARQYADRLIATNFDPNAVAVANDDDIFGATASAKPQEYTPGVLETERYGLANHLGRDDIANIKKLPNVAAVWEDYEVQSQFITREGSKQYTGLLNLYNPGRKPTLTAGTAPHDMPRGSVMMQQAYVELLGFKSAKDAIGKTITAQVRRPNGESRAFEYKIIAVDTTDSPLIQNVEPAGVRIAQADLREVHDWVYGGTVREGKLLFVYAIPKEGVTPEQLSKEIQAAGYAALTPKDAQDFINQIIGVLQTVVLAFGAITLVASFFGVVNTQYISVLERTREIGLMKALGASRGVVNRLFVVEATGIGFIGAALGAGLAVVMGTVMNPWISMQLDFGDDRLLVFSGLQIALLVFFLMFITTLAGLLPARKAAKLDPIEALRTE